jgi:hypothetical protein
MVTLTTFWILHHYAVAPVPGTCSHARPQTLVPRPTAFGPPPGTRTLAALDHSATGVGPTRTLAPAASRGWPHPQGRCPDSGPDRPQCPRVGPTLPGPRASGPRRQAGTQAQARFFPRRWPSTWSRWPANGRINSAAPCPSGTAANWPINSCGRAWCPASPPTRSAASWRTTTPSRGGTTCGCPPRCRDSGENGKAPSRTPLRRGSARARAHFSFRGRKPQCRRASATRSACRCRAVPS